MVKYWGPKTVVSRVTLCLKHDAQADKFPFGLIKIDNYVGSIKSLLHSSKAQQHQHPV